MTLEKVKMVVFLHMPAHPKSVSTAPIASTWKLVMLVASYKVLFNVA